MIFEEKYFAGYILLTGQISLSGCFYFWDIGQYVFVIVCYSCCDVITFEINLIFLIKSFFYITKKSKEKFKYFGNEKSF